MSLRIKDFLNFPPIVFLLLNISSTLNAQTTLDEELKALEQQIEQQEKEQAEAKQRLELETKRKVEEEAKRQEELEKQRATEAEMRRQAEDIEKQRAEEEAKIKAKAGKKEKYSALISEAEQAARNSDKELALDKYNEALKIFPEDPVAKSGIQEAERLPEKICVDFPGIWEWEGGGTINIRPDGTLTFEGTFAINGTWTCADPQARMFILKTGWGEQTAVLRSDGCLRGKGGGGLEGCYWKKKN